MARWQFRNGYYPVSLLLLLLVPQSTTDGPPATASPRRVPSLTKSRTPPMPASPVTYNFIGLGERICPILSSTTTAVIKAMESDSTQLFSVNLPLTVPITLEQIQAPCSQGVMERCIYLTITSNMADQLPQGTFSAFLAGNQTTISIGPLGLSTADGRSTVILDSTHNTLVLHYRSTDLAAVTFMVCSGGVQQVDFDIGMLSQLSGCRVGVGAGGFSVPFEIIVTYTGSHPFIGEQIIVTSSSSCENPRSGSFIELNVQSFVEPSTTLPVTPMDTPPPTTHPPPTPSSPVMTYSSPLPITPTSSVVATPTFQLPTSPSPGNSRSVALLVGVIVGLVLLTIIIIIGCVAWKRKGKIHLEFVRHRSVNDGNEDGVDLMNIVSPDSPSAQPHLPVTVAESRVHGSTDHNQVEVHHVDIPSSDDDNSTSVTQNPSPNSPDLEAAKGCEESASASEAPTALDTEPNEEPLSAAPLDSNHNDHQMEIEQQEEERDGEEGDGSLVPSSLKSNDSGQRSEYSDSVKGKELAPNTDPVDRRNVNDDGLMTVIPSTYKNITSNEGKTKFVEEDSNQTDTKTSRPKRISGGSLPVSRKDFIEFKDIVINMTEKVIDTMKDVKDEVHQVNVTASLTNQTVRTTDKNLKEVIRRQGEACDNHYEDQLAKNQDHGADEDYTEEVEGSQHDHNSQAVQRQSRSRSVPVDHVDHAQTGSSSSGVKDDTDSPAKDRDHPVED